MKYLLTFLLLVSTATAGQLSLTRITGTYSGSGGEFNLTPLDGLNFVSGIPGLSLDSLQSFCLEKDATVTNGTAVYTYAVNTGSVEGGVGGVDGFDPLSHITAWLYQNFVEGTLLGYDYGVGRQASAEALQDAIWYSEDEVPGLTTGATFYQQALDAAPTGIGKIRVLNLFHDGEHRQDQIFMQAPEPSTLLLLGIGTIIPIFWNRRK